MEEKYVLGITDYIVLVFSLLISVAIGIKFRYSSGKQTTMREYVMAGKNMSLFPVVISLSVTMISAITMIGNPVETYRFGMQLSMFLAGAIVGTYVNTVIFTPVYFKCEITSVYEFLELRYGKTTRYVVSSLFIIQMVLFMASVLYAPVLAITAVTDLSLEMSVVAFGLVCAFYCSLGGLKAVLWTDVFQAGFMLICLLVLYIKGISEAGGVAEIYTTAQGGQRLQFFNFQMDLTTRYTFWNACLRGFVWALAYYGTSQVEAQRIFSLSTVNKARAAYMWSLVPIALLSLMCQFFGMILYSIFYTCDPLQDKQRTGITRYDQMVPYYIVTRFSRFPGLTGVCVVGILSGSLSSISSALNSLSTVTVIDLIKPLCSSIVLTEVRIVYIAKALSMIYGIICIGFTFIISKADSLTEMNNTLISIMEGPMLAIFLVGILTRKGSEKCILFSLLAGVSLTSWIGYGSLFSGYKYPALPFNTTGCPSQNSSYLLFQNSTCAFPESCPVQITSKQEIVKEPFILYRLSFMWISTIGCVITLFFIFLSILFAGWKNNVIPSDSKCLSPVTYWWIKKPYSHKRHTAHIDNISLEENIALSYPENQAE